VNRSTALVVAGVAAVLATTGTAVALQDEGPTDIQTAGQPAKPTTKPSPIESPKADQDAVRRQQAQALNGTGLQLPSSWGIVNVRREHHDDRAVTVIRHQPGGYRLGGPHASVVLDQAGTILGFTCLDQQTGSRLPSEDRSEQLALDFLRRVAPDHVDGLTVEWVNQHDETITEPDGTTAKVSGMKVKMHHDSGLYTWVVIGPDESVLTYERDIAWDSGQGRRGTQMWLHDSWIAAHDGTGPQPAAPYAPAGTRS
jgi:hypothetical protein